MVLVPVRAQTRVGSITGAFLLKTGDGRRKGGAGLTLGRKGNGGGEKGSAKKRVERVQMKSREKCGKRCCVWGGEGIEGKGERRGSRGRQNEGKN